MVGQRRFDVPPQTLQNARGFGRKVADGRPELASPPLVTAPAPLYGCLPAGDGVDATVGDQELQHVFQARPKPLAADWEMKAGNVVRSRYRSRVVCVRTCQQVRKGSALSVHLPVRDRGDPHV